MTRTASIAGTVQGRTAASYKYQRAYPYGADYAPVTGYDTIFTAASGIETRPRTSVLTGNSSSLAVRNFIDMLTNKPQQGRHGPAHDQLQGAEAHQALRRPAGQSLGVQSGGGVVALDPSTGAVLALASYPSLRPEPAGRADGTELNKNDRPAARKDPNQPLLNRATQSHLPARLDLQDRHQLGPVQPGNA